MFFQKFSEFDGCRISGEIGGKAKIWERIGRNIETLYVIDKLLIRAQTILSRGGLLDNSRISERWTVGMETATLNSRGGLLENTRNKT